jgi:hypothetical protein
MITGIHISNSTAKCPVKCISPQRVGKVMGTGQTGIGQGHEGFFVTNQSGGR